jgi:hypothetical protein
MAFVATSAMNNSGSSSGNYGSSCTKIQTEDPAADILDENKPIPDRLRGGIYTQELAEITSNQGGNFWPILATIANRPAYFLRDSQGKLIYADSVDNAKQIMLNDFKAGDQSFLLGKYKKLVNRKYRQKQFFGDTGDRLEWDKQNDSTSKWFPPHIKGKLSEYYTGSRDLSLLCDSQGKPINDFNFYEFNFITKFGQLNTGGKRSRRSKSVKSVKRIKRSKRVKKVKRTRKN